MGKKPVDHPSALRLEVCHHCAHGHVDAREPLRTFLVQTLAKAGDLTGLVTHKAHAPLTRADSEGGECLSLSYQVTRFQDLQIGSQVDDVAICPVPKASADESAATKHDARRLSEDVGPGTNGHTTSPAAFDAPVKTWQAPGARDHTASVVNDVASADNHDHTLV